MQPYVYCVFGLLFFWWTPFNAKRLAYGTGLKYKFFVYFIPTKNTVLKMKAVFFVF